MGGSKNFFLFQKAHHGGTNSEKKTEEGEAIKCSHHYLPLFLFFLRKRGLCQSTLKRGSIVIQLLTKFSKLPP